MAKAFLKWLSHSGFVISSPRGRTIIIDPWIADNPMCPVELHDITAADIVLVTHDHPDHTGNAADIVKRTGATLIAAPETAHKFQSRAGVPVENVVYGGSGMNIGGEIQLKGITITMTQAVHSSDTASPAGYIVKLENGIVIYHAGDTGIFESMRLLGQLYRMHVALLPIGGVFTMDPFQASKALTLLKPKVAIPMHYKTLPMLEQDASRFVKSAKEEAPGVQVIVLEPGQEYILG
jgi:L-ascorbate metabolism protein UlaG (beta-lactamase superfamily)